MTGSYRQIALNEFKKSHQYQSIIKLINEMIKGGLVLLSWNKHSMLNSSIRGESSSLTFGSLFDDNAVEALKDDGIEITFEKDKIKIRLI